jgi:TetR/AcrR family transcriptional regulator
MGVAERKQREKEARVESIKNSAIKLFTENGYENTTMAEIAEESEIAKGTVYRFFKSKAELIFSLMEPLLSDYYAQASDIINRNEKEPADITFAKLFDFFFESFQENPAPYDTFMYYKADELEPLFTNGRLTRFKNLMRMNLRILEKLIARGIEQKVFKPVNPKPISTIIWNTVLGIMQFEQNRTFSGGKDYLKETLIQAGDMLLFGLKNKVTED